ncbi:extracellular solute-binding protein [Streptomyces sp. SID4948]|nr:extracellular solute-binding protein [Streptomyces sp. SID4948]
MSVAALFAATACGSSTGKSTAAAAPLADSVSAACTQGAAEGTVNYWVSYDPDTFKKEIAPFEAKYPKIKIVQGVYHGTDITPKLSAEAQAGHALSADLVEADLPSLAPLVSANLVQNVDWTKFGLPASQLAGGGAVQGVRTYRLPIGLAYNTDKVKASDLPSTWDELANSRWKGQVIYDPRGDYLQGLGVAWGYDKADSWLKKFLAEDKPVALQGSTASLQQVASGQAELSTSATVDNVTQLHASGAPIAIKYLDVVPTLDYYAYITKNSPHANAAACFMSWWAGPQGTAQRVAIESKPNSTRPTGIAASASVAALTTAADGDAAAKFSTDIADQSK